EVAADRSFVLGAQHAQLHRRPGLEDSGDHLPDALQIVVRLMLSVLAIRGVSLPIQSDTALLSLLPPDGIRSPESAGGSIARTTGSSNPSCHKAAFGVQYRRNV